MLVDADVKVPEERWPPSRATLATLLSRPTTSLIDAVAHALKSLTSG